MARSPWLPAAVLATGGAFFCFQRALQTGRALPVIALMTGDDEPRCRSSVD